MAFDPYADPRRERLLARRRQFYARNRERMRAEARTRYWADPEKERAERRERYWADPEASRAVARARRKGPRKHNPPTRDVTRLVDRIALIRGDDAVR